MRSILLSLCLLLSMALNLAAAPNNPRFYVWVYQTNNGIGHPGMASNDMVKGWEHVKDVIIQPQLDWFDKIGEPVGIMIHLPHGMWVDHMHADSLDWAKACKAKFFLNDFDKVWKKLCKERHCIAYVGGVHRPTHLQNISPRELGKLVQRNYQVYSQVGFKRICIDTASDAITHDFSFGGLKIKMNNEIVSVWAGDRLFSQPSMIEATPRNSYAWAQLKWRDCVIIEPTWRSYHGPEGEQASFAKAIGYGDPSYIKGKIHRIISHAWFKPGQETLEASQRVIKEGHALILSPKSLIEAGITAKQILD